MRLEMRQDAMRQPMPLLLSGPHASAFIQLELGDVPVNGRPRNPKCRTRFRGRRGRVLREDGKQSILPLERLLRARRDTPFLRPSRYEALRPDSPNFPEFLWIGADPRGGEVEMVGVPTKSGWLIYHANTPPSKRTRSEAESARRR